jgi:hypothetical protein
MDVFADYVLVARRVFRRITFTSTITSLLPSRQVFVDWKSIPIPSFRCIPESGALKPVPISNWMLAFAGMTNFHFAWKARHFNHSRKGTFNVWVFLQNRGAT